MNSLAMRLDVRFAALAFGAALLAGSTAARADILYQTNFEAPLYANGGLAGQDGWAAHSGAGTNAITVANVGTNGNVSLTTSGEDDHRSFTPAVTSDSIYLSADITLSAAQSAGDYFLHLGDGSASIFNARIFAKSSGSGFVMAFGTGSGTPAAGAYGATVLSFGTTYHILARYDFVAGAGNDTGALFVDPADPYGIGDTAYVGAVTQGTDAASMSAVYLRQGAAGSAATVTVDNITVATIPGPASLLAFGSLAMLRRRRR